MDESDLLDRLDKIRHAFLFISQEIRGVHSVRVQIAPFCDTLVLIARTKTYFTPTDYQKCKGEEIKIRKCDVSNDMTKGKEILVMEDQERCVYKGFKEYDASFIWG